jgi:hypothetical protein
MTRRLCLTRGDQVGTERQGQPSAVARQENGRLNKGRIVHSSNKKGYIGEENVMAL